MKKLDRIKEKVAVDAGYKSSVNKKKPISAWNNLLKGIKGDEDVIDFYVSICMEEYSDLQLERVQAFICVLQADVPLDRESFLKNKEL